MTDLKWLCQECVISSFLFRCSKNLKRWMDHCYSSIKTQLKLWTSGLKQLGFSSVLFGKQRKMRPQGVRAG